MIKYLYFLTFFIIISCSILENEKFIPKEKLVNILIEMHVLEASIDNLNLSKDSSMIFFKMREKEIFEKFNTDEETYRESFSHYFFEPKELDEIYETVIDSLLLYQQIK